MSRDPRKDRARKRRLRRREAARRRNTILIPMADWERFIGDPQGDDVPF